MKVRARLRLAVGGLMIAGLMFLNTTAVHAGCGGPNDPNPCPPPSGDKEKKLKTPVPPTNTVPAPSPTLIQPLLIPSNTPDAAMVMPPPPAPGTGAELPPFNPVPKLFPWDTGGGGPTGILIGLLLGILIGMLVPMASRSLLNRGGSGAGALGKGTPGGGDAKPAGSFFDANPAGYPNDPEVNRAGSFFDSTLGKGTPGGGDTNPEGSFFDSQPGGGTNPAGFDTDMSNPAVAAREAALNAREAALNVREAALKVREAASSPKSGFDTDM